MNHSSTLCATTALLASTLAAQTPGGDQLLAFVRAGQSYVVRQDVDGGCKPPVKIANTVSATATNGGGAAYDPATNSVWVSDGVRIRNLDLNGNTLCDFPATLSGKDWAVTGLAFNRARRELIQLEVGRGSGSRPLNVRTYDASKCPPVAQPLACRGRTITGTGVAAAGIAYDGTRDFIYYSVSIAGFFNAAHTIHVVKPTAPCTDVNTAPIRVSNCATQYGPPITGLAYSECGQKLYVAQGDHTRLLQMTDPANGVHVDVTNTQGLPCCPIGLKGDSYQGLAVLPGFSVAKVGSSCLAAGCQSCAAMSLDLVGAPVVGNREFALHVENAPQGAAGSFYLSTGTCSAGVSVPGICGPIYPAIRGPMPMFVGSFGLGGTTSCSGSLTLRTGVPMDPALCGLEICSQWLVVCPSGAGAGLTNAVQFRVRG